MNQKTEYKNQVQNTPEFVGKRNKRLEQFFLQNGFDYSQIRIVGNENVPAVLYQDTYILPCYVHNFELRWTDKQYDGNIIKTFKLTHEVPDVRDEIINLINTGDLKKVFKVMSTTSNLYLIGWNYIDKDTKSIKFPVFGRYTPKVYYKEDKAESIAEELQKQGYACRIV